MGWAIGPITAAATMVVRYGDFFFDFFVQAGLFGAVSSAARMKLGVMVTDVQAKERNKS